MRRSQGIDKCWIRLARGTLRRLYLRLGAPRMYPPGKREAEEVSMDRMRRNPLPRLKVPGDGLKVFEGELQADAALLNVDPDDLFQRRRLRFLLGKETIERHNEAMFQPGGRDTVRRSLARPTQVARLQG